VFLAVAPAGINGLGRAPPAPVGDQELHHLRWPRDRLRRQASQKLTGCGRSAGASGARRWNAHPPACAQTRKSPPCAQNAEPPSVMATKCSQVQHGRLAWQLPKVDPWFMALSVAGLWLTERDGGWVDAVRRPPCRRSPRRSAARQIRRQRAHGARPPSLRDGTRRSRPRHHIRSVPRAGRVAPRRASRAPSRGGRGGQFMSEAA
jgi:hypothetical protein